MEPQLRPLGSDPLRIDASVPSLRRLLVVVGLAAVGVSVWAVAKDTWEPLPLLIPFILLLPAQLWRWSSDSRFGNALWSGVLVGLASGLTDGSMGIAASKPSRLGWSPGSSSGSSLPSCGAGGGRESGALG